MSTEIKVPHLAESISDAVLVEWLKEDGAQVRADEPVATLETDKAAVEIAAPEAGRLQHARKVGERVVVGDVIARIEVGAPVAAASAVASAGGASAPKGAARPAASPEPTPGRAAMRPSTEVPAPARAATQTATEGPEAPLSPAVRRLVEEHGLSPGEIPASGRGNRLLKEDVQRYLQQRRGDDGARSAAPEQSERPSGPVREPEPKPEPAREPEPAPPPAREPERKPPPPVREPERQPPPVREPVPGETPERTDERIEPMSRIRQRIAERLVRAQQTAAILTTFNEIDMSAVLELRTRYRESFEKRHGVKLGFMSFFTRACVDALSEIPELNAEIRGTDIVYKNRVHMGIAVGTDRGLVVPVVRDVDRLGFGEIEREIVRLADRARAGTLTLQELSGGTFTISNGGIYGSLLSTPILNPPQSGILGMHKIEKRPIAVGDQVAIRPMMYVALSYDHRIVDGEQAVTFLVRVKERIEDPERMLLGV